MAFRGRGRGGGRGGFGGWGRDRIGKKVEYVLFPEDVTLPSTPILSTLTAEERRMLQKKHNLEWFWSNSCYHLQEDSFLKSEILKDGKRQKSKIQELGNEYFPIISLSEEDDNEIERYSDRFKPKKSARRETLNSYLIQIPSNFPAELIQGVQSSKRATKKLRWDSGGKIADIFAKFEEKYKDNNDDDDDDDGEKKKKKDGDGDEDDEQEEENNQVEEESDGDYKENEYFDDDEDDFNMEEEPDEQYYND